MAGSIIALPNLGDSDWSNFVTIVEKTNRGYLGVNLSGLDTTSAPTVLNGSVIEINGAVYQFTTAEVFTGTIGSGTSFWLTIVPAGTVVTAVFTASAPTWSDTKHGWYDGNDRYIGWARRNAAGEYIYKHFLPLNNEEPLIFKEKLGTGEWNMDATETLTVVHEVDDEPIRDFQCYIRTDPETLTRYPIDYNFPGGSSVGGAIQVEDASPTEFRLRRTTGGFFDGVSFDGTVSTVADRGFIYFEHEAIS